MEQDLVAGAGLDSWYKTGIRWIGVRWFLLVQEDGHWFRTGIYWCRKVVAGSGLVVAGAELVVAGVCWCRKVVAGLVLVVAGAELVAVVSC